MATPSRRLQECHLHAAVAAICYAIDERRCHAATPLRYHFAAAASSPFTYAAAFIYFRHFLADAYG